MPTKHIDDSTAAELDELYVRCVTLTQQPVKEVEVLRLAIQKGIKNITDDDILGSMSVKNTVWKGLADMVWNEVSPCWPQDAITASNFDALAEAHSKTWQRFPSEFCRKALYAELIREHVQLSDPVFSTDDDLFPAADLGMTAEEEQALREERKRLNEEYLASLPALNGRVYSALSHHEKTLAQHYTKRVSFEPDGNGDFTVLINADN
ncbi:TPA: hypothetical protein OW286_003620 [Citrobacter freundii]|jgi:hypothetical protein|nr:hypothetical protein [Citrobacter freundii]